MKKTYKRLLLLFIIVVLSGCKYTFPEEEVPTSGSADFTKVVAFGNSLTAGMMNNALYNAGQEASYANIIAQQIKLNGGGNFNQPDINSEVGAYGGNSANGGRLHLVNPVSPTPKPIIPGDPMLPFAGDKETLNNFGVSGIRIVHVDIAGYGVLNPYYGRFSSDPSAKVLDDVTAADGSFILIWLGNNDVLGYALEGATGALNGTNYGEMTPVDIFKLKYDAAIDAVLENGAKGIVANIPDIQDIPYFTTVPWNTIPMDTVSAELANTSYAPYNAGLDAMVPSQIDQEEADLRKIQFIAGNNGPVITDTSLTNLTGINPALLSMRMANSTDLLTLVSAAVLGVPEVEPVGVATPLGEEYTLTKANQEAIAARILNFNTTIKSKVDASNGNLTLVDVNSVFKNIKENGANINGAVIDATITPPFGAFSLDGVHPNPRGSAFIASLFIDKINEIFGSNIPNVNPNNYAGNEMPVPE